MQIRKTRMEELDTVMDIYAYARCFMAQTGNPKQWGSTKPAREQIIDDIQQGNSYVCIEQDQIAAVFFYKEAPDPTYRIIYEGSWPNDRPYGVIHRIASAGLVKGAGSFCLNWAFSQCKNLRIDTHHDNKIMQHTLQKNGFSYCGIIHLANGDPRMAYQKVERHF